LDLDLFGPSAPVAMGTDELPEMTEEGRMIPIARHGVPFLSMGMLAPGDRPVIWRGPMLHKAVLQLASADWGELDYLVLDLPPGTGDIQLTVTQSFPVSGAVIVTTPQQIALLDAAKGLTMFQQARIPILGLVENMSVYICPGCGKRHAIFGQEGGQRLAEKAKVPLLARVPLDPRVMVAADRGRPIVLDSKSEPGMELRRLATLVAAEIGALSLQKSPFKVLA
jgi:ATP-binding protein involved in chromosome partitioning